MSGFTSAQIEIIHDFMSANDVPGAAIAIVEDGRVCAEGGFGLADCAAGREATARTRWPVASLTKSFTALAAMQLAQAKILDLDRPVGDYLPRLVVCDPGTTARLTTRRLLTHSGGLGRTGHQDRTREEAENPYPSRAALLAALHEARLQSPVGQCFSYSNEGYAIVGHLIETLRGRTLEECFRDGILAPAGMTESGVSFRDWRAAADRVVPYAGPGAGPFDSGERHGARVVVRLNADYQTFLATGGLVSTAHDMARYQIATMDYGGSSLRVAAGALDHMHSLQFGFGDTGWGYGLGYFVMWSGSVRVIGHSGGLPGVSNYSLMIPAERAGVVVLTNRSDRKALPLAEGLLGELRGVLWRPSPSDPLPFDTCHPPPSAEAMAEYAGTYRFRKGRAEVRAVAGGLEIRTPSRYDGPQQVIATRQVGADCFLGTATAQCIAFVRDQDGRVGRFLHTGYTYEREAAATTAAGV